MSQLPSDQITDAWLEPLRLSWQLADGVAYLNHGSFGPAPVHVLAARSHWQLALQREPMDFFLRQMPEYLVEARTAIAQFVDAAPDDVVLVDNATTGMNIVAATVRLQPGDEVLLNDHEYGAVQRIWQRACEQAGAQMVVHSLPMPLESPQQVVDSLASAITPRTRILVVSHVTSPTAIVFPVGEIVAAAHARGVAVAIDGPHAVGMVPLNLQALNADFYTASCHKWLSAPFGSGFLHVHRRWQDQVQSPLRSWGRPQPGCEPCWRDELEWLGTRDPSALLSIPAAIHFLGPDVQLGWERFRQYTHGVIREWKSQFCRQYAEPPLTSDDDHWFGSMVAVPLPDGDAPKLQAAFYNHYRIEAPVIAWRGRRLLRVSWHLYNRLEELERLNLALRELLGDEPSMTMD